MCWSVLSEATDTAQTRMGIVGDIKRSVKERNAFGDAGEQTCGEGGEIFRSLKAHSGGGDFGLDPGLGFAVLGATLKRMQAAADLADFIRTIEERDGLIQLARGEGLNAVAQRKKFLNDIDVKHIGSDGEGDEQAEGDDQPSHQDGTMRLNGEFIRKLIDSVL